MGAGALDDEDELLSLVSSTFWMDETDSQLRLNILALAQLHLVGSRMHVGTWRGTACEK